MSKTPSKSIVKEMDTAPQDGTHITLIGSDKDQTEYFAMWQKSRKFEKGKWIPTGKWVHPYTRDPIKAEPIGWKDALTESEALKADVNAALAQRRENEDAKR